MDKIKDFIDNAAIQYVVIGLFIVGYIVWLRGQNVYKSATDWIDKRFNTTRKRLKELGDQNTRIETAIDRLNDRLDYGDSLAQENNESLIHISEVLHILSESDKEQLRQDMDKIYHKYVEEKKIPLYKFKRFQALYENYARESGNGEYKVMWEDVKTWEKIVTPEGR